MSNKIAFRMKGYVIVGSRGANCILLSTFAHNRRAAWRKFLEQQETKDKAHFLKRGFKSVGVEILTDKFLIAKK